ncbi:hypothetical protein [Luteimonas aquatica]|uniref:hypothetical protein n=1 Tax=Luteimonas aquatica TaxID=450364 RepID=UPI001F580AFC|nr:hypothetical protein [Luteimonas aquatica]
MRVIGQAVVHAWSVIESDPAMHLAKPTPGNPAEDIYTDALCELLLQMLKSPTAVVPGFSSAHFEHVSRAENLSNYNAQFINKQPDLIIQLADGPLQQTRRYVGIYVETKIVSMKTPISRYTDEGLKRFIVGDYAWAMQGAMMIAYQAQRPRPRQTLEVKLAADATLATIPQQGHCFASPAAAAPLCGNSMHQRTWHYHSGDNPGPIRVWHMWSLHIPGLSSGAP